LSLSFSHDFLLVSGNTKSSWGGSSSKLPEPSAHDV
jgi:hypothetical protein